MLLKNERIVLKSVQGKSIEGFDLIQELWGGYGHIIRCFIHGGICETVIVKQVKLPSINDKSISHMRKLRSYRNEASFYEKYSIICRGKVRIPQCFGQYYEGDERLIILEDLSFNGYPDRKTSLSVKNMRIGLDWLASFHSLFMGCPPEKLWENGSYWHLAVRPDELSALSDINLKKAAAGIDRKLSRIKYKTIIHGDAKLENFCFSKDMKTAACLDFQYTGGGCGMKDLAYFVDSCLSEEQSFLSEKNILDYYFSKLKEALAADRPDINPSHVESEWRSLYHTARADFYRFLKGWGGACYRNNSYVENMIKEVIDELTL